MTRGQAPAPSLSLVAACALVRACVASGLDLTGALGAVGRSVACDGARLEAVAEALRDGLDWDASWAAAPARLAPLARALRPAWERGASPLTALDALASSTLAAQRARATAAAARLGVRLAAPLALCLLPAFVAAGIVPLLVAVGAGVVGDVAPVVGQIETDGAQGADAAGP